MNRILRVFRNFRVKNYESFVRNIRGRRAEDIRDYRLTPETNSPTYISEGMIGKCGVFTAVFCTSCFVGASICEYERIRRKAINTLRNANPLDWIKRHKNAIDERQRELNDEISRLKKRIKQLWYQLTPGERVWAPILLANVIVFGLWRIPSLRAVMLRHFASNPASQGVSVYSSMFFSTFSHYSMFHLFANMYVLHSFSSAVNSLGTEQFLALYLSAGVFSSFTSYAYKALTYSPGYSLGASGAIMAILAYTCAQYPDSKLSIMFIPQWQFSAGSAIQVLMCVDLAGMIFRWKLFDHAAHLGGAALGLFWAYYGRDKIWPQREHLIGLWHQLRGKPTK